MRTGEHHKGKVRLNRRTVIVLLSVFIALFTVDALAATRYVRDGGSGGSPCTGDWSDACDSFGTALGASSNGDVIYVADGNYTSTVFNTTGITVKKCYDGEGTCDGVANWQTSYGDGQGVFSGTWDVNVADITIDGGYRDTNDWTDETAYGFYVTNASHGFRVGENQAGSAGSAHNFTLRYTAVNPGDGRHDGIYINGTSYPSSNYGKVQYCYIYDAGRTNVLGRGVNYWLFEYNFMGDSCKGTSSSIHGEAISIYGSGTNNYNTFRYNYWVDWGDDIGENGSTGGIMMGDASYVFVYGNVFTSSEQFSNNGVLGSWSGYTSTNWRVYNNTFINTPDNVNVLTINSTFTGSVVRNNAFFNNSAEAISNSTQSNQATDGTDFGNNTQTDLTNIFATTKNGGYDFRITSATDIGYTLTNETVGGLYHTYETDMDGTTRGSDGNWDRGAFEYNTTPTPTNTITGVTIGNLQTIEELISWNRSDGLR